MLAGFGASWGHATSTACTKKTSKAGFDQSSTAPELIAVGQASLSYRVIAPRLNFAAPTKLVICLIDQNLILF